jgi:polysaccharide biosynthesis/export protein
MVNPGETVVVSKAGIVYVLGDVNRPGEYTMTTTSRAETARSQIGGA